VSAARQTNVFDLMGVSVGTCLSYTLDRGCTPHLRRLRRTELIHSG